MILSIVKLGSRIFFIYLHQGNKLYISAHYTISLIKTKRQVSNTFRVKYVVTSTTIFVSTKDTVIFIYMLQIWLKTECFLRAQHINSHSFEGFCVVSIKSKTSMKHTMFHSGLKLISVIGILCETCLSFFFFKDVFHLFDFVKLLIVKIRDLSSVTLFNTLVIYFCKTPKAGNEYHHSLSKMIVKFTFCVR